MNTYHDYTIKQMTLSTDYKYFFQIQRFPIIKLFIFCSTKVFHEQDLFTTFETKFVLYILIYFHTRTAFWRLLDDYLPRIYRCFGRVDIGGAILKQ